MSAPAPELAPQAGGGEAPAACDGIREAGGLPVLEARDLEVTPPGAQRPAVRGVTLQVRPGEWLALAGPNGGGKTSLLLALAGLWPVSAGRLTLEGARFGPVTRAAAAGRVATVLQDPSSQLLQPTVGEELAFAARNLGRPEPEIASGVERWSRMLGLEADLARDPLSLSAGAQQRLLLASALVARPRLLLADEPTAHLDAAARAAVRAAIAAEVAAGLAVVWATQDRAELEAATRVVTLGETHPKPRSALAPGRPAAAPLLRLEVSPGEGWEGPSVRVGRPLEIEVAGRGVTALIGPNGAGKSVLLSLAAGIEKLSQVRVAWTSPPRRPPILALQYPEQQLFAEQVADELAFAAVSRGIPRLQALAEASAQLAELELEPAGLLGRRTWSLSAGEKRLVLVIGALVAPAGLVLLDEPTAGLDPARRQGLARLVLRRARREPVLVASQDMEWVDSLGATVFPVGL